MAVQKCQGLVSPTLMRKENNQIASNISLRITYQSNSLLWFVFEVQAEGSSVIFVGSPSIQI